MPIMTSQRPVGQARGESELVFHLAEPGCVLAYLGNMTFCCWQSQPTLPQVESFIAMANALTAAYPLCSNLTLVLPGTQPPGLEATRALESLTGDFAKHIHAVAMVVEGTGFWASIIRSFLTGLHALRGNGYRCKSFQGSDAATQWMLPTHNSDTGTAITSKDMATACVAIRQKLAAMA